MNRYLDNAKEKFKELKFKENIKILAIETSCDETSVAIVENGRRVLSNIVATQIPIHERFGGVVPEVASRNHITAISNVTRQSLKQSGLIFNDIDCIAVTYGAGLVGALLVGVNYAKALAYALEIPLIAVNHIQGHIAANYITYKDLKPPFICLMISGGHTAIFDVMNYVQKKVLGSTADDAAGEVFDKVARVLGLGYPGGPKIDELAKMGENNITFVNHKILPNSLDFSFSGLKTAVVNYVHNKQQRGEDYNKADVAASFQAAVSEELVEKTIKAAKKYNRDKLVVAGGVAANSYLKELLKEKCFESNILLYTPNLKLCTDNAAMIGSAAYYMLKDSLGFSDLGLTAQSTIPL